ncbi:MAG: hypothetical protein CMO55_27225 [Verrucomicrobiales bacterium]|nr:hypothetical protein [Verrucomicrobiales bacterium]
MSSILPRSQFIPLFALLLLHFAPAEIQGQNEGNLYASRFQPPGMWIWDNWFVHDGDQWHAFYLQVPKAIGKERRWKNNDLFKHVGHATAKEAPTGQFEWKNSGPALFALPGTWNDRHIATGSIIRHEGKWWQFFTGRGINGDGVGLALSDDLNKWNTEPAPLIPLIDTFAETAEAPYESVWQGETRHWAGISDPYIYPKPVDGWFYLVLCSRILDVPIEESGCLTLMRSQDLKNWESAGIMAWPRCFERMETPQLLHRPDGNWSLIFGGVVNSDWAKQKENQHAFPDAVRGKGSHKNYVYHFPTEFLVPAKDEHLHHIATPPGHYYIMKVISLKDTPDRSDLAFFTATEPDRGSVLSEPFRVKHLPEGGIELVRIQTESE